MTLLFCDSFDNTTATNGTNGKYDENFNVNGSNANNIGAVGRFGNGIRSGGGTVGANGNYFGRPVSPAASTIITGHAFRWSNNIATNPILQLLEGSTVHIDVRYDNSNDHLYVTRAGTQLGSTGTTTLLSGVWYYIELKVTIHDTTGSFELRIDNNTEISATNVDTRNGGTGVVNRIRWIYYSTSNTGVVDRDDVYICDGLGSRNNNFLGDSRVQAIFPTGNGNSSQLVGSDGNSTDNYLLVDEATPATADYVESAAIGDKDTYVMGNVTPTTGVVAGVQIWNYSAKTDAGTKELVSVARLSGTEEDGPNKTLSTSFQFLNDIRETKPGGGDWTISDVNNAEFGVKVAA